MNCMLKFITICLFSVGFSCFATENVTKQSLSSESKQICSPNDCYTVLKKLGEGAFGEVFAVENSIGEQFALKTYKDWIPGFSKTYANAEREFSIGQFLNHPNIIKSFDLFSSESKEGKIQKNLVLQLVEGEVFFDIEKGKISKNEALRAAITLCHALKYAHSLGLMHIDLHPFNLMLNENLEVMVVDLASFFTLEEFMGLFRLHEKYSSCTSSDKLSLLMGIQSSKADEVLRLQQIISQNPQILNLVRKVKEKVKQQELKAFKKLSYPSKHNSKIMGSSIEMERDALHHSNFNDILESCITLVKKANLSRDEKWELRANIMKFSWDYEDDIDEEKSLPIDYYFDAVINFLKTQM